MCSNGVDVENLLEIKIQQQQHLHLLTQPPTIRCCYTFAGISCLSVIPEESQFDTKRPGSPAPSEIQAQVEAKLREGP